MSIIYVVNPRINTGKILFSEFLKKVNSNDVWEISHPDATKDERCITDGLNYVWVSLKSNGEISEVTGYGINDAESILSSIESIGKVKFVSEYDDEFADF